MRNDRDYFRELEAGFRGSGNTDFLFSLFWRLYDSFGPQYWWPGQSPFEIAAGAILTQNTSWKNVEKAISSLKSTGSLTPEAIWHMAQEDLAGFLRPAGYYNIKARRLKNFVNVLLEEFNGDMAYMAMEEDSVIRKTLLQINGVGPETADSIMLYALEKPSFVIDAYTFRILERHDIIDSYWDYAGLRDLFMESLPRDVSLFNEYHALFVMAGKTFCKTRQPKCDKCPVTGI